MPGETMRMRHHIDGGLYCRRRDAERPRGTIFYIHGLGESCLSFEGLIQDPRLSDWNHLALDMPGYGKSPWRGSVLGLADVAELLGRWLGERNLERLVIVGHSMGGVIGTELCERLGERCLAFVNVEGNLSLADCSYSSKAAACSLEEWLATGRDLALDEIFRLGLEDPPHRTYYASCAMGDPRVFHRHGVELVEASRGEGLARRLAVCPVPRIYLLGDPRGTGERSRQLLDEAGVAWRAIDQAGHWPFLDQPAVFVDELLRFLTPLKS